MELGRLVSLGTACEVAYQIKLHTPKQDADYFDWLITPFDALVAALRSNFAGMTMPGDMQLLATRDFVLNTRTGILYGHVFPRDADWKIVPDYDRHFAEFLSRSAHLRQKFDRHCRSGGPVTFVRRGLGEEEARQLVDTIATRYGSLDFHLLAINATEVSFTSSRVIPLRIEAPGPDGLGRPEPWGEALLRIGATDRPFQKQRSDILPAH